MNHLQIFKKEEVGEVRAILLNNEPHFNLYDLGFALGQIKIAKDKTYLRKERMVSWCETLDISGLSIGGQRVEIIKELDFNEIYVSEQDMYDLLLESGTEKARPLRRWLAKEVLPSIRKTGSYSGSSQVPATIEDMMIYQLQEMKNIKLKFDGVDTELKNVKHQVEEVLDHVTLTSKQVKKLTTTLKQKLETLTRQRIKADDYVWIVTKGKLFTKYQVKRWEEIPVSEFDAVFADIDSLENLTDDI